MSSAFLVPYDILFSNEYLRDLGRIWELREIVPDPNNMPWIEKIDNNGKKVFTMYCPYIIQMIYISLHR